MRYCGRVPHGIKSENIVEIVEIETKNEIKNNIFK